MEELINLRAFEETHKFVRHGKNILLEYTAKNDNGRTIRNFYSIKAASEYWSDRTTTIEVMEDDYSTSYKTISTPELFVKGSPSNVVDKHIVKPAKRWDGIVFKPGIETSVGINHFNGFPVTPKDGDIGIFMDFMKKAIYNDNEVDIVMNFFAHIFQFPMIKPTWALVFKGGKGVGKNTVESLLGRYLLDISNYYITDNKEQAFGKFNAHTETNLLMVLNETVWGGNHEHDSSLKGLITEPSRAVERKGYDSIMLDNYSRVVVMSNSDWVVPASGKSERRYAIIQFLTDEDEKLKPTKEEFKTLYDWFNRGGGKEAIMYHLLNRDLEKEDFDAKSAPKTAGLKEQLEHSLAGVQLFIRDALERGYFGYTHNDNGTLQIDDSNKISSGKLFDLFLKQKYPGKISHKKFTQELINLTGCKARRSSATRHYEFPSLNDSLKHFEDATGVTIEHEDEEWNSEALVGEMKI